MISWWLFRLENEMNKKEAFSLGKPENVIFKEPPDGLDESWFGAIVGTFGGFEKIFSLFFDSNIKETRSI